MNRLSLLLSIAILHISTSTPTPLNSPTNPSIIQLPPTNNTNSIPNLPNLPSTHPAYRSWPTPGTPMLEEYTRDGSPPQHVEYYFRIDQYGSTHVANRDKIITSLRQIAREIKSGPDEIGPTPRTYSDYGVLLHVLFLAPGDEERIDARMLRALVRELRLYSESAIGVKDVVKAEFGSRDGNRDLRSVATWQLVVRE